MKKHLKLFSLITLAIAGIGVSFASVQKESLNQPEVKEASAAGRPTYLYFSIDSEWKNVTDGTNKKQDLGNFCIWLYYVNWASYSVGANDRPGCYLSNGNAAQSSETRHFNCTILKPETTGLDFEVAKVDISSYRSGSSLSDYDRFMLNDGTLKESTVKDGFHKTVDYSIPTNGLNWLVITTANTGSGSSGNQDGFWSYFDESNPTSCTPKNRKLYVEADGTWWRWQNNWTTKMYIGIYSKEYAYSVGGIQLDLLSVGDAEYHRDDDTERVYFTVNLPYNAQKAFVRYSTGSNDDYFSTEINLTTMDENKNLVVVSGETGSYQNVAFKKAPFSTKNKIYFDYTNSTGGDWATNKSSIKAVFYGSGCETDYPGTVGTDLGNGYCEFEVPSFATYVYFTNNSFSNVTNKCIVYPDEGRTYYGTSNTAATYSSDPSYSVNTSATPSSATARIFMNVGIKTSTGSWVDTSGSTVFALMCWNDSCLGPNPTHAAYIYIFTTWFNDSAVASGGNTGYYNYVDIPKDSYSKMRFVILNSSDHVMYGSSDVIDIGDNSFSCCYFNVATSDNYATTIFGTINEDGSSYPGITLMEKLLENRDTCNPNPRNGYGSASLLWSNFYTNAPASVKNHLVYTREDYSSKAGLYSPTTVNDIMVEMNNRASGSGSSSAVRIPRDYELDSSRIVVIVVISSLSLMAFSIITLYINKKRKHS